MNGQKITILSYFTVKLIINNIFSIKNARLLPFVNLNCDYLLLFHHLYPKAKILSSSTCGATLQY